MTEEQEEQDSEYRLLDVGGPDDFIEPPPGDDELEDGYDVLRDDPDWDWRSVDWNDVPENLRPPGVPRSPEEQARLDELTREIEKKNAESRRRRKEGYRWEDEWRKNTPAQ